MRFLLVAILASVTLHKPEPGLLIVCEKGGVHRSESHIGSGFNCVLHDKSGEAVSAAAISVYDDGEAPGP